MAPRKPKALRKRACLMCGKEDYIWFRIQITDRAVFEGENPPTRFREITRETIYVCSEDCAAAVFVGPENIVRV